MRLGMIFPLKGRVGADLVARFRGLLEARGDPTNFQNIQSYYET